MGSPDSAFCQDWNQEAETALLPTIYERRRSLPDDDRPDFEEYKVLLKDHVYRDRGHIKDGGFYEWRYREPVLSTPLETLADIAKTSGGVIDEKTYPGMHVQAGGVNWQGARLFEPEVYGRELSTFNALPAQSNAVSIHDGFSLVESPQTSMQALVHKLVPTHPQATWHINPETREFLITT